MSPRPSAAAPILCIIAAVWLIFWPVLTANFVHWDDPDMIWQNPDLNPPTLTKTARFWTRPELKLYTPLAYTTWSGVASLHDLTPDHSFNPAPFHLLNVFLHTTAAVLAFLLLRELTALHWAAWLGAMFFALHPMQVEPVAWASGMNNLLCGTLSLAALWTYVRHSRSGKPAGGVFAISTVLFALALLSKPTAVAVPLMAVAIDRCLLDRPLKQSGPLLIWAAMSVTLAIVARKSQPPVAHTPYAWRIPIAIDAVGFYAAKLIVPLHLSIDYERSPRWLMLRPTALWRGGFVVLATVFLCINSRTKWLRAPLAIILFGLLPVLGLISFDFQDYSTVADRYMYLPMFGIALAVALGIQKSKNARTIGVCSLLVLIVFSIKSFIQTWAWHDTESLAANQFQIDPDSSTAHKILASWLSSVGRDAEAEKEYRAATIALQGEGKSGEGRVWFDYANLLLRQGRTGEAIDQYQLAFSRLSPDQNQERAKVLNNLGMAYYNAGDLNSARAQFRAALNIQPNYADARLNLSRLGGD